MISFTYKGFQAGSPAEHTIRCCTPADYGFEYSDEEPEEEDVDIENQYYNSKGASAGLLQLHAA